MNDTHFTQQDRSDLQEMKDDMRLLKEAVCGDPLHPESKPGLLNLQINSAIEMHGDERRQITGFKQKLDEVVMDVAELKMDKAKIIFAGSLITFIGGGATSVVLWLLVHFKIIPA